MAMGKNETREEYNARMTKYMREKYLKRRQEAIEYLGGFCVDCKSEQMLEFDHVDQSTKSFSISSKMNSAPWHIILSELDKCVLRCVACHAHVTAYQKIKNLDVLGSMRL